MPAGTSERLESFFGLPDEKGRSELRLREFATDKTRKILVLNRRLTGLAASPDGWTILYGQAELGSDLMLVENFTEMDASIA